MLSHTTESIFLVLFLTIPKVPSGEALLRMAREAEANGVKYVCGRSGTAVRLIYDDKSGTCVGVLTADGLTYTADVVILGNGAQKPTLIEAKDEVKASGSAVAVIELTPAEAEKYKDIPIIDDFDRGQSIYFQVCYGAFSGDCISNSCVLPIIQELYSLQTKFAS